MKISHKPGIHGGIGSVGIVPAGRRSYLFNASNSDYVTIDLPIFNNASPVWEFNIYADNALAGNRIYSEGNAATDTPYFSIAVDGGGVKLRVSVRDNAGNTVGITTTDTIVDANAHNIKVSKIGTTMFICIDGGADKELDISTIGAITLDRSTLGAFGRLAASSHYNGNIWDLKLKDSSGFVEWYQCSEGRIDNVALGQFGNNGTVVNADLTTFRHNGTFGYQV